MATVETAIALDQSLLENAEAIAKVLNVSRNQVLEMAVAEFVHQYQTRQSLTLDKVNKAYADASDPNDESLIKGMRRLHRQVLENKECGC